MKISEDLNLCIKNLNSELLEVYSKNSMESLISTFKIYNFNLRAYKEYIYSLIPLNYPYLAALVYEGMVIIKKLQKPKNKIIASLITKIEFKNKRINYLSYLGNQSIICGNDKTFYLINFDKEYKTGNIVIKKDINENLIKILKINDRQIISLNFDRQTLFKTEIVLDRNSRDSEDKGTLISKWILNKEKKDIQKICVIKSNDKDIIDICQINKKYFAYSSSDFIHILHLDSFKEHIKINYEDCSVLKKYNNKIIGAMGMHDIIFFNIENGKEEFRIIDDEEDYLFNFIVCKYNQKKILTVSLKESLFYHYGSLKSWKNISYTKKINEFSFYRNKWRKFYHKNKNLESKNYYKNYISDPIELEDKSIIDLYEDEYICLSPPQK